MHWTINQFIIYFQHSLNHDPPRQTWTISSPSHNFMLLYNTSHVLVKRLPKIFNFVSDALLYRASVRMYSHLALMDTFELRPTSRSRWSLWLDGLAAVALLPVSELWVLCCIQLLVLGVAQCPFRILIDLHLHPLSRSLPSVRFIVVLCCSQWLHLAIPEHGYHFLNPRSFCLMALLTYL